MLNNGPILLLSFSQPFQPYIVDVEDPLCLAQRTEFARYLYYHLVQRYNKRRYSLSQALPQIFAPYHALYQQMLVHI